MIVLRNYLYSYLILLPYLPKIIHKHLKIEVIFDEIIFLEIIKILMEMVGVSIYK